MRRTVIVSGGHAAAGRRLRAARGGEHGLQVLTVEQMAQRLAGGFLRPVDGDTLTRLTTEAVAATPPEQLGDLAAIAELPGLPAALAGTLAKAWRAGIDLATEAAGQPGVQRLETLAALERHVVEHLPQGMLRPCDLVRKAGRNIGHAAAVLGPVELDYLIDVDPVWRPLLLQLHAPHWHGNAATQAPAWWQEAGHDQVPEPAAAPAIRSVTCATARHEVIEAMRWARSLLAQGVDAADIAFAAAAPGEYDDLVLALSYEASLPIHFAHGRRALSTRDGQAAAALATILLHGLSQDRVRRLAALAHEPGTPFGQLPDGWLRDLPGSAPLGTPDRWRQAVATWSAGSTAVLLRAIDLLVRGPEAAAEAGETMLRGAARLLWRRALLRAPATALEGSLGALRLADTVDAATAIGWMHAASLACCPRPHAWLFGLNARTWPRGATEDPLLPDHVIASARLQPLSITQADRLAFAAIRGTTAATLVCSASRRDATGRLLGLSPLMPGVPDRLRRARIPEHAMSEQDRLMARPAEFATTARAASAASCWADWNDQAVTAHDGLVRAGHPALLRALDRLHSATSLRMLLRNPLGFTWRYALGWREPDAGADAMELDALQFGNLVHQLLDAALPAIDSAGGVGRAGNGAVHAAVAAAVGVVRAQWEATEAVPPALLWRATLERAAVLAVTALCWRLPALPGNRSYAEVSFGDPGADLADEPWNPTAAVTIPGTAIRIQGRIDRIDLSRGNAQARLVDYKTGRPGDPGALHGGRELQRCLYAFAVQALLGEAVEVEAMLLYPRGDGASYPLVDPKATLRTLTHALELAHDSVRRGHALPGEDTGGTYDDLKFALPAGPGFMAAHKAAAARQLLGAAADIWSAA